MTSTTPLPNLLDQLSEVTVLVPDFPGRSKNKKTSTPLPPSDVDVDVDVYMTTPATTPAGQYLLEILVDSKIALELL